MRASRPVLVLIAVLSAGLAACGGGGFGDAETVARIEEAVLTEAPEAGGALRRTTDGPIGPVEVYVDQSLSVRPYLAPVPDGQPAFARLVEALDNNLGGDVTFFGFGFEPDSARQTVTPVRVSQLLDASQYRRLNNDYGALFAGFAPDSAGNLGPTRIVVTDGVESDPEGGPRFGRIVAAADQWVRAGGVFATFVYRVPYSGVYYSEGASCPRGTVQLSCPDRPLVAFVFAPTAEQVAQLAASVGDELQPEHVVRIGARDAALVPLASVEVEGERKPLSLLRDLSETVAPGFEAVHTARIDTRAADAQGFVPLSFEFRIDAQAQPWRSLSAPERAAFIETLRPNVRAWAVESRRDTVALASVPVDVYRPTVTVDSAGVVRVTIPVKKPAAEGTRRFAFLVSLVPYQSAQRLVPPGVSTASDCAASACGQTLNLAPLLGAILRDDYVPARALLLAEWR